MRLARPVLFVAGLGSLAAVGAVMAVVLLSTIGGAPADDPVGRLRPAVPGASVPATTSRPATSISTTGAGDEPATTTHGDDTTHTTTDDDGHGGRGRDGGGGDDD